VAQAAPADPAPGSPLLSVTGITVRFGGLSALDDVSLSASTGSVLGVIGPNGAGKTTLFNVICGFVSPHRGQVVLAGRSLGRIRTHHLTRLGVARTLQGVGLWPGLTVAENVMVGARHRADGGLAGALLGLPGSDRRERALRAAAGEALARLDLTPVADRVATGLPYGIQKKVSLARALVTEPRLLLLDEPASGLSEAEMSDMGEIIRDLRTTMAVMLVEHHMDLVMSVCDQITVLNFGAVIATGTPEEIRRNPAVTAAYLGNAVETPDGSV
jgi:branched-chain amino acid transport system ATP-binding protein